MNWNRSLLSSTYKYLFSEPERYLLWKPRIYAKHEKSHRHHDFILLLLLHQTYYVIYDFGFNNHDHERKMLHSVKHSMYLLIPTKNEELHKFLAANSIWNFSRSIFLAKSVKVWTCLCYMGLGQSYFFGCLNGEQGYLLHYRKKENNNVHSTWWPGLMPLS